MRLQSAIFTLGDTLFTPDGAAREGLDKALSLFKMEGVWLGAVTALSAEDAQKALEKAGLNSYFRFVLTESVALCKADSGTMFERAMKRLHSQKDDTIGLFRLACGDPKREGRGFSHRGGAGKCGRGGLVDDAATRHAEPCAVQRIAGRFCVNFGKTTGFDVFQLQFFSTVI